MDISSLLSIIQTIIILVLVIAVANFSLKMLNNHMKSRSSIIRVVERVSVNSNSYLGIVDICGTYYLMSFSDKENKILKELKKEEVEEIIENTNSSCNKKSELLSGVGSKVGSYFGMGNKID